jgi:hypothetical protein
MASTKERTFLGAEIIFLVLTLALGVLWAWNPSANYEPFTLISGLAVGVVEIARRVSRQKDLPPPTEAPETTFRFSVGEEAVEFEEKLRSLDADVVKIHAYTHVLGVAAEYAWIKEHYPNAETLGQALSTLDLLDGSGEYGPGQIHFDVISIQLESGREKEVYFDISSFFGGGISSNLDPKAAFSRRLRELYR